VSRAAVASATWARPEHDGTVRTLEDALKYEAPDWLRGPFPSLTFYLQICKFLSGAEGIRTPDLRRAKALRAFRVRPYMTVCVA
jgi:hypothetical protein